MIFCIILFPGKDTPPTIHSPGPRLVLLFKGEISVAFPSKVFLGWFLALWLCSGGETAGSGFKAQYTFETEYQIPGNYLTPRILISKLNGPKDTLLMHPEPSSNHHPEYENQSGHNSNYQELQDQARAISHTAPQVALMEGGRFTRFSFVYKIRFKFCLNFWQSFQRLLLRQTKY